MEAETFECWPPWMNNPPFRYRNKSYRLIAFKFIKRRQDMPLVRIDLISGKPVDYRLVIGEVVYRAMTDIINVPAHDRFQVIAEHSKENFIYDKTYLGISRTDDCVFIQVTLNEGRSVELKQQFYAFIANELHEKIGIGREDILINLIEVAKENWSFGNGEAQYV